MFYSQDFLTSSAVGLKTIWLAGTLSSSAAASSTGSFASLRRFNKRDVASTDLPRACEVIQHPPQPIALRLSGHLMHGAARVYTKQNDYWMSDVNAAYTAFRRVILQKQTSTTTASGLVIVGSNETSAIDMPPPRKRHLDNITLPMRYGVEAYDLRYDFDPFEWNEDGGGALPGGLAIRLSGSNDSLNDSLSAFGSSMWSNEEQRRLRESVLRDDGSVDLGLGVLTTPGEHRFTANPAAIRRSSSLLQSPLHQRDLPFMGGDDDLGMLGLGDHNAADGSGLILDLDAPGDLTLGQDNGDYDILQDTGLGHGFDLGDNGAIPGDQSEDIIQQAKKRRRVEPKYDCSTVLNDTIVRFHRDHYTQHMKELRAQQALQAAIKDCERRTRDMVRADDDGFAGASIVKALWHENVDVQLKRLASLLKNGGDKAKSRTGRGPAAELANETTKVFEMPFDDQPFDMMAPWQPQDASALPAGTLAPRGTPPDEGDESNEIGRGAGAGLSGDRMDMPWSRAAAEAKAAAGAVLGDDSGGIDAFIDDTVQHLSTRSITIETPTGLKRVGGAASKTGSASGAHDRSSDVGTPAQAGRHQTGQGVTPGHLGEALTASQALVEQDMIDFLAYAKRTRDNLSLDDDVAGDHRMASTPSRGARRMPFLFSDVAPITDTKPAVAARAFHHILALATAGLMTVEQREPYGEIQIEMAA